MYLKKGVVFNRAIISITVPLILLISCFRCFSHELSDCQSAPREVINEYKLYVNKNNPIQSVEEDKKNITNPRSQFNKLFRVENQIVDAKSTVILSTTHDREVRNTSWAQQSGPRVSLRDYDGMFSAFTAPDVKEKTVLSFEVIAQDFNGHHETDHVQVIVTPDYDRDGIPTSLDQTPHPSENVKENQNFLKSPQSDENFNQLKTI